MLKTTTNSDVVKDKASNLLALATETIATVKDKAAPVAAASAETLAEKAADARDAAAPHVANAKAAVAEAAAPHVDAAKDAAAPHLQAAKDAAAPHLQAAKDAAAPHVQHAKEAVADAPGADKAAQFAGLTKDQAHSLFAEDWMPKIQAAIASATAVASQAGTNAYVALPESAQRAVETVVPAAAKKRKKKGMLLIVLGLATGAAAAALIVQSKKNQSAATIDGPADVADADVAAPLQTPSDDLVGDMEARIDSAVAGEQRGRHAAR